MALKTEQEREESLNPAERRARELSSYENKAANKYSHTDSKSLSDYTNDYQKSAKDQEENPQTPAGHRWTGTGKGRPSKQRVTFKGLMKKKGPLTAIIATLLGSGFGLTMLFTPGLLVIQMKEVLTDDLNDQLAASNIRSTHVMRAKLKGLQVDVGVCSSVVNIRCKFASVSDRRLDKLRKAGFEIETRNSPVPGRSVPRTMSFVDSSGNRVSINNPGDLYRLAGTNSEVRSALRKAYNPKYATLADATMKKVFSKIPGLHKRQKVPVTSDKAEARKAIVAASRGATGSATISSTGEGDETDEQRQERERANQEESDRTNRGVEERRSGGLKAVGGGAIRGVGILGAVDSACVVKSTSRAIEVGAKVARAYQLANFAMVFLTMADAMKDGNDVKPEQAEVVGDILTATDMREKIEVESVDPDNPGMKEVDNPYYQKNALDSNGYKLAAYGDIPSHNTGSIQYMIGGTGMLGTLSSVNDVLKNAASDGVCEVVTHPITRIIGGAVGIVVGIASGGASLLILGGASIAISLAIPYLEGMLIDMLAGMAVDENTVGPQAGDAIFAGSAFMFGQMAQNRGMQPMALDNPDSGTYFATTQQVKNEHAAYETELARSEPFNIYNQYSFLGSFARKLTPAASKASYTVGSIASSISSIYSSAASSLNPVAKAADFNEDRYKVCNDNDYSDIGINADGFCNIRYMMTGEELEMDTEANLDWMISNNQIEEETGEPVPGSDYEKFMKNCVDRFDSSRGTIVPFGVDGGEGDGNSDITDGAECIDTNDNVMPNISHFRVYTMDRSLQMAIDEEEAEALEDQPPVEETEVIEVSGEWAAPMASGSYHISSGWRTAARPNHIGVDLASPMDTPYFAVRGGIVTFVGRKPHGTNYITISHGNGIVTEYGHSYLDQILVKEGDRVEAGQQIGKIGNQGNIITSRGTPTRSNGYGAHLHFNYLVHGRDHDPVTRMSEHGISI